MVKRRAKCEEILSRPDALQAFQSDNFTLVTYFKKSIKIVFKLALTDSSAPANVCAYHILTTVGNQLAQDVINQNLLMTYFSIIFENGEVNEMLASRFSVIASVTLASSVNLARTSVQLYEKLIDSVHILAVYYFIQAVFIFPDRYSTTKGYILDLKLHKLIANRIKKTMQKLL